MCPRNLKKMKIGGVSKYNFFLFWSKKGVKIVLFDLEIDFERGNLYLWYASPPSRDWAYWAQNMVVSRSYANIRNA